MLATTSIFLDTRRIKKTKKYPVKLRVYHQGVTEFYQTTLDLPSEDFKKLGAPRINEKLQEIKEHLKQLKDDADAAIKELYPFSFEEFERKFVQHEPLFMNKYAKKCAALMPDTYQSEDIPETVKSKLGIFRDDYSKQGTIGSVFAFIITKLLLEGRVGSAENYDTSFRSFMKFKGNVLIQDVNITYLTRFENWMLSNSKSKTTIGIYVRNMRAVFNEAIAQDIVPLKLYPFGRRKYRIPSGKNIKKALELSDIKKVYNYQCDPNNESEQKAKDFWFFSYFGNGINMADIAHLKYKDIHDDFIIFERVKTERATRENPTLISVFITEDMQQVIEKWGNKDKSPNNYIFPILNPKSNVYEQYNEKKLFLRVMNDWLEHIRQALQIKKKLTTYVARHTFSTVMKNSGASIRFIQEALGHQSSKTTENYLASFENETKKKFASNLEIFKNARTEEML